MRRSVDLPQPEGPTNTTNSPELTARSMPWITSTAPYDFTTLRSRTSDIAGRLHLDTGLRDAGVDDQVLPRDSARLVRGEEQRRARDVVDGQPELQALLSR